MTKNCQLPIANCQSETNPVSAPVEDDRRSSDDVAGSPIANRQLEIGNSRRARILAAIETVADPEIPVLSVVDLGIIADVRIDADRVTIDMTPTFAGCPALAMIREQIREAVLAIGERDVTVRTVYDPPWTSERITERGRQRLKEFGLAPPTALGLGGTCSALSSALVAVPCPHCGSTNTDLESLFGPTLCRSIHYCRHCLQSFEHFKPL